MRVILSGGGTAGHIYPALAVAELLRANGHEVHFIGTPEGVEARLVTEAGVPFLGVPSRGFDRSRKVSLLPALFVVGVSALRSLGIMRRLKPTVVVGFGGYVSIPVGIAAWLSRRPLVIHEQNSVPGMANRFLSRWARAVAVTYEMSSGRFANNSLVEVTGNPVRSAVRSADRSSGRASFGIPDDAVMLLVFGGSRGARHINSAMTVSAAKLMSDDNVHVVHVAGRLEVDAVRSVIADLSDDMRCRYHVHDYIKDMGGALAASDLVISRAGATSLAEITLLGKAAVLVPYPYATDDHQTTNADAVADAGGAVVVSDGDLDASEFIETVTGLLADRDARATMAAASRSLGRSDSADAVVAIIERFAIGPQSKEDA